jgi:hypothetical protein
MLGAMGNLAERYRDADRSGVYGVRDGDIPRTAAGEAQARLIEVAAHRLCTDWAHFEQAFGSASDAPRACVVLVREASQLPPPHRQAMLERLAALTHASRQSGRAAFVVLVDPEWRLGLAPLYREKPGR